MNKSQNRLLIGLILGVPAAIALFTVILLTILGGAVKNDFGAAQTAQIEEQTKTALNQQQVTSGGVLAEKINLVPQPGLPNQWTGYVESATGARTPITVIYDPQTEKLIYRTGD